MEMSPYPRNLAQGIWKQREARSSLYERRDSRAFQAGLNMKANSGSRLKSAKAGWEKSYLRI